MVTAGCLSPSKEPGEVTVLPLMPPVSQVLGPRAARWSWALAAPTCTRSAPTSGGQAVNRGVWLSASSEKWGRSLPAEGGLGCTRPAEELFFLVLVWC